MSKAGWIGGAFGLLIGAVVVYLSMGFQEYTCEVCVDFNNRQQCRSASGSDRETTVRTAQDNACAFLVQSKTDGFLCAQAQPRQITCKP